MSTLTDLVLFQHEDRLEVWGLGIREKHMISYKNPTATTLGRITDLSYKADYSITIPFWSEELKAVFIRRRVK